MGHPLQTQDFAKPLNQTRKIVKRCSISRESASQGGQFEHPKVVASPIGPFQTWSAAKLGGLSKPKIFWASAATNRERMIDIISGKTIESQETNTSFVINSWM